MTASTPPPEPNAGPPSWHELAAVWAPAVSDEDWADAMAAGPGAIWTVPDYAWTAEPPEPAIPVPAEALEIARGWDELWTSMLCVPMDLMQAAVRAYWLAIVGPRTCDCPMDPHHRWNCPMTPLWAQTIRDLDTNPWTGTATWFMANRDFASLWSAACDRLPDRVERTCPACLCRFRTANPLRNFCSNSCRNRGPVG